jgi:DNA-binding IclR family transcriptional regulator
MRDQASVTTVTRALRMLAAFDAGDQEIAVREFAALLGVHKSTASRLAATLATHRFLERAPSGDTYRLGPEAARIGLLAAGGLTFAALAQPTLDAVAAEAGETVVLSIPAGAEALDVAQSVSPHVVGATTWIGRRTPLHASSDGKVFLAFAAASLPPGPLVALTPYTVRSRAVLEQQLAEARERGWTQAVGDYEDGLNGVAAPVFDHRGDCVAAVSVSGPSYRVPPERLPALGRLCVEAAEEISGAFQTQGGSLAH